MISQSCFFFSIENIKEYLCGILRILCYTTLTNQREAREAMIPESILMKNKYQGYIVITLITLVLMILPMLVGNKGMLYGSEGDWYQQHVAIVEALRQTILDSKTLFPQYIGLGGGSNIYDFAYYGLYRIDLLLSCLFPGVGMKYIVAGYAALGVVVSGNLCFYWLKTQRILDKYAFVGAFLLVSSTCFYQAHHQIMFVNYMPFLILALIGTDRMKSTGKIGMLIISLFLIYIHSFFYSISCLCVWLIYYIYQSRSQSKTQTIKEIKKVIIALTVSMGLAAILLIPAGLDILSTTKDGGRFSNEPMKLIDFTLEGLLFSPYGCGMSIFALYLLLTSLTSKKKRILAVLVLICFLIPTIALVLNGFLYPRAKVLIPFVLLVVLLCADTLQEFCENRKAFPLWPLGVCLLTIIPLSGKVIELKIGYNDVHVVIAVSVAIATEITLIFFWGSMQKGIKVKEKTTGRCIWIVLLAPLLVNLAVNTNEMYLKAENLGENVFSDKEITAFAKDGQYRFEMLYDKM
ncbi:MAG: YfhO family protein, partial [Anaerovoracaceae bacterium]